MTQIDPASLHDALVNYYSLEEIKTLCFNLRIDYESLDGSGKAGKARGLVQYAENHNRYDDLVAYVNRTRPHAHLKIIDDDPAPVPEPAPPSEELKQQIIDKLSEGQIKEALLLLRQIPKHKANAVVLQGKYARAFSDYNRGTITREVQDAEYANITTSILSYIEE
ncbi:MAG: hypothetical protein AAF614_27355 [Chloroflexota bacterium]